MGRLQDSAISFEERAKPVGDVKTERGVESKREVDLLISYSASLVFHL